jgi:hypothetical protein
VPDAGDEDCLQNINSTILPNGSLCWVINTSTLYVLIKAATAGSGNVIPIAGAGAWVPLSGSGVNMLPDLNLDAFGRLQVSTPETIFDTKQIDQASSVLLVPTFLVNGGTATYNASRSSTFLNSNALVGGRAVRQTRRKFNYSPGKGQHIDVTLRATTPAVNTELTGGLYDDTNGIYFSVKDGPNAFWTIRSDAGNIGVPTETKVAQADWNVDVMDGSASPSNPSGLTLDPTAQQVCTFLFEWLGAGDVQVGFSIDNNFVPVHVFRHANISSIIYMRTPNLPLRWEAINTGPSVGGTLESICGTVISDGGVQQLGVRRAHFLNANLSVPAGETRELISIRLLGVSTANNAVAATFTTVFAEALSVLATSVDNILVLVGYNPTFAAGATAWGAPVGGALGSSVEVNTNGRLITGTGLVMAAEFASTQVRVAEDAFDRVLALGIDPASGIGDVISLMVQNASAGATTVRGALTWREIL